MAAAPTSSTEFLELILKSGLLTNEGLNKLGDLPAEPKACANALIAKGVLTKFQSKLLLGGRYKGFKLGSYFIREQIGQGGMGAVYLAEHETLRRKVALKVLTLSKDDNAALSIERFLREARSAAALDHPNIVRLHDVGKQADTHYLVMEYVEGRTLEEIMTKGGPISSSRAVEYIAQAAAGLQHASEKGFVHRDIKPSNLMLTKDGTIKILDMGLARPTNDDDGKLTEVMDKGAIVGTADFISPEQAMNGALDVRSDIYSLGATFFALVTGQPPFGGNTTQKLIQHQMKDAPSVTAIDKTFPPGLSAVVAKMLAKKPENRYQSPAEVITALAEWLPQQASTRVAAAISGTGLARSAEMQTTLCEIATGGTKRIDTQTRLAATPRIPSRWFWPALAAGVLVLVGGTVAALTTGGKDTDVALQHPDAEADPVKPQPKKPTTTPKAIERKTEEKKSQPKKEPPMIPVALNPATPTLVRLNLANAAGFTIRGHSSGGIRAEGTRQWTIDEQTGPGSMPDGWTLGTYANGCIAEAMVHPIDGQNALGFHAVEGTNSMMLAAPRFECSTGKILVSFEYMIEESNCAFVLRFAQHLPAKKAAYDLLPNITSKPGEWHALSKEFDLKGGTAGLLELHPRLNGRGFIWIRNFTLSEAGSPGEKPTRDGVLHSINFKSVKLASTRFSAMDKPFTTREIDGVLLPLGVHINQHRPNVVSEYCIADIQGVRAFGYRLIDGETGVQIHSTCGDCFTNAKPGESFRIRIVYRHDGTENGSCGVQIGKAPYTKYQNTALPPTGGSWHTVELVFVRPPEPEKYELIMNAGITSGNRKHAEGMIYIQSIDVSYADAR